jgi:hypothetical protein
MLPVAFDRDGATARVFGVDGTRLGDDIGTDSPVYEGYRRFLKSVDQGFQADWPAVRTFRRGDPYGVAFSECDHPTEWILMTVVLHYPRSGEIEKISRVDRTVFQLRIARMEANRKHVT